MPYRVDESGHINSGRHCHCLVCLSLNPLELEPPHTSAPSFSSRLTGYGHDSYFDTKLNNSTNELILSKPPLVEAILEVHWQLVPAEPPPHTRPLDVEYQLFVGRFQSKIEPQFPFYEGLATAQIPGITFANVPQHRFRVAANQWPVLQLGPGVLTINQGDGYNWHDFRRICVDVLEVFHQSIPGKYSALKFGAIQLRYVNAEPLSGSYIIDFLSQKMGVGIAVPPKLSAAIGVQPQQTLSLSLDMTCASTEPKGAVRLDLRQALSDNMPALVWTTSIMAAQQDLPDLPIGLGAWLDAGRGIAHRCFLALTEDHLLSTYR